MTEYSATGTMCIVYLWPNILSLGTERVKQAFPSLFYEICRKDMSNVSGVSGATLQHGSTTDGSTTDNMHNKKIMTAPLYICYPKLWHHVAMV